MTRFASSPSQQRPFLTATLAALLGVMAVAQACSSSAPPTLSTGGTNPGGGSGQDSSAPPADGAPPSAGEAGGADGTSEGSPPLTDGTTPTDSSVDTSAPSDANTFDINAFDTIGFDGNTGCDILSCGGCCAADGTCPAGTSNNACGAGGNPCQDCTAIGQTCSQASCH